MNAWIIALIIIVVLAFIVSNIMMLKKSGGFHFPDSYEKKPDLDDKDDDRGF